MSPLLVVDAAEIVGHFGVGRRPLGRTLQRRFRIVVTAEEVFRLRRDLQRLNIVWRLGGDPLERGQRLGGMSRQQLRLPEREQQRGVGAALGDRAGEVQRQLIEATLLVGLTCECPRLPAVPCGFTGPERHRRQDDREDRGIDQINSQRPTPNSQREPFGPASLGSWKLGVGN